MKRIIVIASILIMGIAGGVGLAGCGKREMPTDASVLPNMQQGGPVASTGNGTLYVTCWKGLTFMNTSHGLIQVMDSTGKPMECK